MACSVKQHRERIRRFYELKHISTYITRLVQHIKMLKVKSEMSNYFFKKCLKFLLLKYIKHWVLFYSFFFPPDFAGKDCKKVRVSLRHGNKLKRQKFIVVSQHLTLPH